MTKPLTEPQMRTLRVLRELCDQPMGTARRPHGYTTPRTVALTLWPDSPGWNKVSNRGSTPAGGARGATMPMKAATVLWRLHHRGLAYCEDYNRWSISQRGRGVLDGTDEPLPERNTL